MLLSIHYLNTMELVDDLNSQFFGKHACQVHTCYLPLLDVYFHIFLILLQTYLFIHRLLGDWRIYVHLCIAWLQSHVT